MSTDTATTLELPETITISWGNGTRDVPGVTVAPGLALRQADNYNGEWEPAPNRYTITHLPTGKAIPGTWCPEHHREVVEVLKASGVDWTTVVSADPRLKVLGVALRELHHCRPGCPGDLPTELSWRVRCNTCDWEYEPFDEDDGLPDKKSARRYALEHQCEPWVEIAPPVDGPWRLA